MSISKIIVYMSMLLVGAVDTTLKSITKLVLLMSQSRRFGVR